MHVSGPVPDPSERPESGASGDFFHRSRLVPKANSPCASGPLCAMLGFLFGEPALWKGHWSESRGWVTLGLSFVSLGQAHPLRPGLGPAHGKDFSGLDKLESWLEKTELKGALKTQREAQK